MAIDIENPGDDEAGLSAALIALVDPAVTLVASGTGVSIGTSTYIVIDDLDPVNYDYRLRMRLRRGTGGAAADYLKLQFGDQTATPVWLTDSVFVANAGSEVANLTTSGGITRIAQVQNDATLAMGVVSDITLDQSGSVNTVSVFSAGFMWENLQRLDGSVSAPIGAIRLNTNAQTWTADYAVWAFKKTP